MIGCACLLPHLPNDQLHAARPHLVLMLQVLHQQAPADLVIALWVA